MNDSNHFAFPIQKISDHPAVAVKLLDFWNLHKEHRAFDQICLYAPYDLKDKTLGIQLRAGCGSLKLQQSKYTDNDFVHPVGGTEFIEPMLNSVRDLGYRVCRPMIRELKPKSCLSYHTDSVPHRYHLVISTHLETFFVVQDRVCRMPKEGSMYSLKTDVPHTAVNASLTKTRLHFTFSVC